MMYGYGYKSLDFSKLGKLLGEDVLHDTQWWLDRAASEIEFLQAIRGRAAELLTKYEKRDDAEVDSAYSAALYVLTGKDT